jgi:uncharacterized protein YaeQ
MIHQFEIELADADRDVYQALSLRVARHPSESEEYLVTRVLAYCLEYRDGIQFSRGGLSDPDEPAVLVRDLTGALQAWIEVGVPDAARLHRAAKASPRVVVYCHKQAEHLRRVLADKAIHRLDEIALYAVDRALVAALVARLDRRVIWSLTVSGGEIYLSVGDETLSGRMTPISIS